MRIAVFQFIVTAGGLAALSLVEQAGAAAQRYLSPRNLREIVGHRVLLWLKQGNLSAAAEWAATYTRAMAVAKSAALPQGYWLTNTGHLSWYDGNVKHIISQKGVP